MKSKVEIMGSDIAPREGRSKWRERPDNSTGRNVSWAGSGLTLTGRNDWSPNDSAAWIKLNGKMTSPPDARPVPPWIEMEGGSSSPVVLDLWLTGTRPLPVTNITCICRHPGSQHYLVAATTDARLLILDENLDANLAILAQIGLDEPIISLAGCGQRLLALTDRQRLLAYEVDTVEFTESPSEQWTLPVALQGLAECDAGSVWGVDKLGHLFRIKLPPEKSGEPGSATLDLQKAGRLHTRGWAFSWDDLADSLRQMIKDGRFQWRKPWRRNGLSSVAFDGQHLWSCFESNTNDPYQRMFMHKTDGTRLRSFICAQLVKLSSINYYHNGLLVLDLPHQLLHQYTIIDSLQPVAGTAGRKQHPGYLAAGGEKSGGIHDLCLLYVGGEGKTAVHRYDIDKLIPLVAYVNPRGDIEDKFMDGFLWLAQYSPLLNGASFGTDLPGPPSRQEDWQALFDEYFHPQYNLQALDRCVEEVNRRLTIPIKSLAVVLGIPTPDRRCRDWNGDGLDLADDEARVKVTEWAVRRLYRCWQQAGFKRLRLAGFYYLTEQGALNDPVLMSFPDLCRGLGLRSYAIPGMSSTWMTEFSRAGFDATVLQPSHSFWKPFSRPRFHLLKSAGRIARNYGMGMEIELPYNVLEPEGQQKVRDYLRIAAIQGWAGAFKAYFQSYNLIRDLAESEDPATRQLYDDLYSVSRRGYENELIPTVRINDGLDVSWQAPCPPVGEGPYFNLNIEAYEGAFHLTSLELVDGLDD